MRNRTIAVRPTSRRDLAGWYAKALADQRASGLSVAEYAVRLGVAVPTLYQWRRRLDAGQASQQMARLVEVTAAQQESEGADGDLVLRLVGGRRSVVVPRGFDCEELRRLIGVLESC